MLNASLPAASSGEIGDGPELRAHLLRGLAAALRINNPKWLLPADRTEEEADAAKRWSRRPAGSTWGDFGADDELGRLNLLTATSCSRASPRWSRAQLLPQPAARLSGRHGAERDASAAAPVAGGASQGRRLLQYEMRHDVPGATDVVSDDEVFLSLQYSTHWDALSHVGQLFDADGDGTDEAVYYNGYRAGADIVGATPTEALSAPSGSASRPWRRARSRAAA